MVSLRVLYHFHTSFLAVIGHALVCSSLSLFSIRVRFYFRNGFTNLIIKWSDLFIIMELPSRFYLLWMFVQNSHLGNGAISEIVFVEDRHSYLDTILSYLWMGVLHVVKWFLLILRHTCSFRLEALQKFVQIIILFAIIFAYHIV